MRVSKDPNRNWSNNAIQFPRLLAEASAVGLFDSGSPMVRALLDEMDIGPLELGELLDRAHDEWDKIKAAIPPS